MACKQGHLFCKTCIDQWINAHNNGKSLLASDLRNINALDRVAESMKIFCPQRYSGCQWTGALDLMTNHQQQCLYAPVQCTHPGCGQVVVWPHLTCDQTTAHIVGISSQSVSKTTTSFLRLLVGICNVPV